ncbi:SWIM zinc finger family protein [Bilophila wadsworthia]|uniref:SWIM zinc finger family protein n=1 Tax=Bilophila wadsworthia TaxID=35833 RepID=UPI003990B45E
MELTSESVLALAPDASSVKAAQALLKPGQWPTLGFNENAVWGECKGSGSKPYQVEADLSGPVFKCTCPSRKFPCKHSLALLLLRVQQEAAFTQGEAPDWVKEWLDAREKRAARQEQKQENKGQPADPAAAAKREASRLKRMAAGLDDLERWMCDLIRHGLGQLSGTPAWQEEAAARMVDAQLPGIAARLPEPAGVTSSGRTGPAWCWPSLGSCSSSSTPSPPDALSPEEQADVRVRPRPVPG